MLTPAIGIADGEHYLVRLFRKTGTDVDVDLLNLIHRGVRRVHRVLSSREAREVLVEVTEVVQDDAEIGILMLDPGSPIHGTTQRRRAQQARFLVGAGRVVFWRNIARVAQALALCHDAGIVHGGVSTYSIFSHADGREDYRLGGYEACINIAEADLAVPEVLMPLTTAISFRQDWVELGRTASDILGIATDRPPALLAIETRLLDRLNNPPNYQLFDGKIVIEEIEEVIAELGKAGSSADGELVLYPSRKARQSDLATLTSGTIPASDIDGVIRFVESDLRGPNTRIVISDQRTARIVTDLAFYNIELVDQKIGQIRDAHKRRPHDWSVYDANELAYRIHLVHDRNRADDRVLRLGPGAKSWSELAHAPAEVAAANDDPVWFSLILLEAFSLLREQYRIFPVDVLPASERSRGSVLLRPRVDPQLDHRRAAAGLKPAAEALNRELANDDGKSNWTLSRTDALSGDRERSPQLTFEDTEIVDGRKVYNFTSSEVVMADSSYYLRPRRDSGFENAVRRRLNNIVSARRNLELLRLLDDPSQVAIDEALRTIAAPGPIPDGMDKTKAAAWNAIAHGQSVNVVVGPPGVGKTYLISNLVKSILSLTSDARILVVAQNHDTLVNMENELNATLRGENTIVVRIERTQTEEADRTVRKQSCDLLQSVTKPLDSELVSHQVQHIQCALRPANPSQQAIAERVHRDTETLLVRAADITLATTSSYVIEDMIADGEQFDWVFVEEAARANGAEMIGALLLGNRRVMIGDHNQLSPFDHAQRQEMYESERAAELLGSARAKLATFTDLPAEVDEALQFLENMPDLVTNVLAIAARLEEPFRTIAEREADREKASGQTSWFVNMLTEQSRMHPSICDVVSNTFYQGKLFSSDRVKNRRPAVRSDGLVPNVPIVVLNLPPLSKLDRPPFETRPGRSLRNETEARVIMEALKCLKPIVDTDGQPPTLAILSPYKAQVDHLKELLSRQRNDPSGTLSGFVSPRSDGNFVFTSDSFQGSEADVVLASLVRNNVSVGTRALGFMRNAQRMNVLMSRAKHKLVLVTSLEFIIDAAPDHLGSDLGFLRTMVGELRRKNDAADQGCGTRIVELDADGLVQT